MAERSFRIDDAHDPRDDLRGSRKISKEGIVKVFCKNVVHSALGTLEKVFFTQEQSKLAVNVSVAQGIIKTSQSETNKRVTIKSKHI